MVFGEMSKSQFKRLNIQQGKPMMAGINDDLAQFTIERAKFAELLGDELRLLDMIPDYDDVVWQDLKSPAPWIDLDGVRCDIAFAKNGLREEIERLLEAAYMGGLKEGYKNCSDLGNEFDRMHKDVSSRYVAERIFAITDA